MPDHDDTKNKQFLNYDDLGFIVGMKRVERNVGNIDTNVEAILKILSQALDEFKNNLAGQQPSPQQPLSAYQRALLDATQRTVVDFEQDMQRAINPVNQSMVNLNDATQDLGNLIDHALNQQANQDTNPDNNNSTANRQRNRPHNRRITPDNDVIDIDSTESVRRTLSRQRDANGRFSGASANGASTEETPQQANGRDRDASGRFAGDGTGGDAKQTFLSKIANGISGAIKGVMPDSRGVDPTVDAINELGTLLSPIRRVASFALKPLAGLFKSRKRNEPIPREQEQHQRRQIRLLQRIADRIGRGGSSGGGMLGGLFGGIGKLFKGGGKGLLKLLKFGKGIPVLGALAAGASLFDWKKQSTEEKGGTVGSLAGGAAGAALGSLLGPVGTIVGGVVGAWAGEKLGTVVAPYVKNWTDNLIRADIPGRIVSAWKTFTDGLSAYFKEAWNNITEKANEVTKDVKDTAFSVADWGASVVDKGLAALGNKDAQDRVDQRDRGEVGYQPENYVAKTINDAPSIGQTIAATGNALMTQPASGKYAPLLDEIASGEARGGAFGTSGYDAIYSGAKVKPSKPISQMTVGEVKAYQQQLIKAGSKSTAVGRYQFIRNKGAFDKMVAQAGLKDSDVFNNTTQDKLAIHYAGGEKQIDKWVKTGNHAALTNKIAQQWASQKNTAGVGNYDGDGLNKARHGGIDVISKISKNIANGQPDQVVPQPTSAKKPAEMPKNSAALAKFAQNAEMPTAASPAIAKNDIAYVWKQPRPIEAKAARSNTTANVLTKQPAPLKVEPFQERLNSPAPKEVVVVNQNNDTISQNVGDRSLAHAFTGGIGMGSQNG